MGVGIYLSVAPAGEGAAIDSDGKLLCSELYHLDGVCIERGLTKLSAYTDNREPPPGFVFDAEGDPDELEELLGEWNEWFDPTAALPTVRGLREALVTPTGAAALVREPALIGSDLLELEASLERAAAAGSKFRLEVF